MIFACNVAKMWIFMLFSILPISYVKGQTAILDSRCYLEGGGSAENFLASEDLAVGSIIGKLRINGDPSITNGNITLSLRERGSPVKISPGTKDLVLVTGLDKEGIDGPSSVYVNIICDRRHSTDPSFVIPVNVRVTDVNDNAPQWVGAPYSLPLSEVTVPGTRILQGARAIDKDQQGPFSTVEYQVLPGPYSDYVSFVSPLEGTLVLRKPLDYETLKNFTVTLRAQDQGSPPKYSDTTLNVIVEDADDQNPIFLKNSYRIQLPTDGRLGELNVLPEPIKAVDQDEGIRAPVQYSILPSAESRHFAINAKTGTLSLVKGLTGFNVPQTITLVIKATQINNADRYALATVIISANEGSLAKNSKPLAFLQSKFQAKVPENLEVGTLLLALPTNRPGRYLRYNIRQKDQAELFSIGSIGEVILQKPLDYEKTSKHLFTVEASDGASEALTEVIVDVLDVNDWEPRFRQNHYDFMIPKNINTNEPIALGKLEAADGDVNDRVTITIRGAYAHLFDIDPNGMLWLKQFKSNITQMHLIATATDSGVPPRSSSVPVTVSMEGLSLARATSWAPGILGIFGGIVCLFVLVIVAMSAYIYKQKNRRNKNNRVHSQDNCTSAANLVNHEKFNATQLHSAHNKVRNPLNKNNSGSGSSISAGASTILAASLEREAQRERERENYAATVRSIISKASAARGGQLYDTEMDHDSISNSEIDHHAPWNNPQINVEHNASSNQRSKNISWNSGTTGPLIVNTNLKTDFMESTDNMGSTENNLTVYF